MPLSSQELNRYSRQIMMDEIGIEGQEIIKNARVLVAGAGGLGSPVLFYLAAAGVGTIGIIDNDQVEESNLQRQILYHIDDDGLYKAEVAARKLALLNPNGKYFAYSCRLSVENVLDVFASYDIIVDCTDNFPTRYLISDACVMLNKPCVFGAVFKFEGQVTVLNYQNGPTLRCLYPDLPSIEQMHTYQNAGIIGYVLGIIGSMQASEVIKLILGQGEILSGRLFVINTSSMETHIVSFSRDPLASAVKSLGKYEIT